MLFEMSLIPLAQDGHTSGEIAQAIKIIEESGLPFEITPSATLIEGNWEECSHVIQACHREMRRHSPHVVTFIKVEDKEGAENLLQQNVASVEEKIGHELPKGSASLTSPRSVASLNEKELEQTPV